VQNELPRESKNLKPATSAALRWRLPLPSAGNVVIVDDRRHPAITKISAAQPGGDFSHYWTHMMLSSAKRFAKLRQNNAKPCISVH
jgi:hypothetical protein